MTVDNPFFEAFFALETFEKGLNVVGYIPIIGGFSSSIRKQYAYLEAIAGVASVIFSLYVHSQECASAAKTILTLGITLIGHACLNVFRSYIENMPGLPLVTVLPYDLFATYAVGRRFFSYL